MREATINIDIEKIGMNAKVIADLCRTFSIEVTGVTKATCGMPQVASAMLEAGVTSLGESRLENVNRLRQGGINSPVMLLRIPPPSQASQVVRAFDISLNSELSTIEALSSEALRQGKVHDIIIMVELGDLREGVLPSRIIPLCEKVVALKGVEIVGVGANLMCFGAVLPSESNMNQLVRCAERLEERFDIQLRYISAGNSSALPLLVSGKMPARINHLRIGFTILLGRNAISDAPWPGTHQDAFVLNAEVIECKKKPSLPIGVTGIDAFGNTPSFKDKGERTRGILSLGRADVAIEGLQPNDRKIELVGASGDHLIIDVTDSCESLTVGQQVSFQLGYAALVPAMISPFIDKQVVSNRSRQCCRQLLLMGDTNLLGAIEKTGFVSQLESLDYRIITSDPQSEFIPLVVGNKRATSKSFLKDFVSPEVNAGLLWIDAMPGFSSGKGIEQSDMVFSSPIPTQVKCDSGSISAVNIAMIGLSTVSSCESELICNSAVTTFTMEDIDDLGISDVMRRSLRVVSGGTNGVYLCFDVSVLEGTWAGTSHFGGLSYREACRAMEMIEQSGLLLGVCVTGVNPEHMSLGAGRYLNIILSVFGKRILR